MYGDKKLRDEPVCVLVSTPVNKWDVFLEDLKTFGLCFLIFLFWFTAIFSFSRIGTGF